MPDILTKILKGKVVIVGIGNILRADDGFGPALVDRLATGAQCVAINAGTAPESYAGKIIKEDPETILLVDAAHLGKPAGSYAVLKSREIVKSGFTTHDLSPRLFLDYLQTSTRATIYMLAVEPQDLSLGCQSRLATY